MNPFIPKKKANTMIVDGRISKEIEDSLKRLNLRLIKTIKCKEVQEPVSYHPDICIHPINHKTLVVAPNVFEYYSEIFKKDDIKLIEGEKTLGYNYPDDISYNVGRVGRYAIHNEKYMDPVLKYNLLKEGIEILDVKQGYSKCSVGIIDDNSIITSDKSIYRKLRSEKINVLLVSNGYIELEGYSYGFIGGSMGNIDQDTILISGSLKTHIDGNEIREYILKRDKKIIELSKGEIVDVGSFIGLYI